MYRKWETYPYYYVSTISIFRQQLDVCITSQESIWKKGNSNIIYYQWNTEIFISRYWNLNLCHDFSFCSMNYSFVLNYPSVCSYPYLRGSSDIRLGFVHPLVSPVRDCILIFIVALLEWAGMLLNHSLLRSSKNWPISGMFILLKLHL